VGNVAAFLGSRQSLSDKALQNFAADMHALGKDALVNEVRQVQSQVAVLMSVTAIGGWSCQIGV